MVGEPDDVSGLDDLGYWILDGLPRALVHDPENRRKWPMARLLERPAGEGFGHTIHEAHACGRVRDDDCIADARQRDLENSALAAQRVLDLLPVLRMGIQMNDGVRCSLRTGLPHGLQA